MSKTPLSIDQIPASYADIKRLSDELTQIKKTLQKIEDAVTSVQFRLNNPSISDLLK